MLDHSAVDRAQFALAASAARFSRQPVVTWKSTVLDENLRLDAEHVDGELVVFATGEIDAISAPSLSRALLEVAARSGEVRLDCAGVTFMDSSGLHALVGVAQTCGSPRAVTVRNPSPIVERLLQLSGLDDVFSVVVTDNSARTSLAPDH